MDLSLHEIEDILKGWMYTGILHSGILQIVNNSRICGEIFKSFEKNYMHL